MLSIPIHLGEYKETACYFLFGKEAGEVFPEFKGKDVVVNRCLELLMRVNIYFLMNKVGYIFDAKSMNTQCHLFNVRIAQIKREQARQTPEAVAKQLSERTQENRFLHLGMFLNFALLSRPNLYRKAVNKVVNELRPCSDPKSHDGAPRKKRVAHEVTIRQQRAFLVDLNKSRELAARAALVDVFKNHLRETLKANNVTPLQDELYQLSLLEDDLLKMPSTTNKRLERNGIDQRVYTYPNFSGMVSVTDFIAKEKIALVVKAKVMTKEGACGIVSAQSTKFSDKDGVFIYEGIFTDGTHTISEYREVAKSCPTYYFQKIEHVHKKDKSCDYCKQNPTKVDLKPYQARLERMMKDLPKMLLANGAVCTYGSRQKDFLKFFKDSEKFPNLSALFKEASKYAEQMGISDNNFSICHGRYDLGKSAASEEFVMDQDPKQFLRARALI